MSLEWRLIAPAVSNADALAAVAALGDPWRLPTFSEVSHLFDGRTLRVGGATVRGAWAADVPWDCERPTFAADPSDPSNALAALAVRAAPRSEPPCEAKAKQTYDVRGFLDDAVFQQCVEAKEYLAANDPEHYEIRLTRMLGADFEMLRKALVAGKRLTVPDARVVVEDVSTGLCATGAEFIAEICRKTRFRVLDVPPDDPQSYAALAKKGLMTFLRETKCMYVWMTVSFDGIVAGRLVMQLYANLAPRTSQNFVHLCRGDLPPPTTPEGPVRLHYKGTTFYRVVRGGWVQGGDVSGKGGTGGWSSYGRFFPDETFAVKHDAAGIIGMANDGAHTNASSFYMTVGPASWMNGRYVAFGRVVEGLEILERIRDTPTRHNQSPKCNIVIADCGQLET